MVIAINMCVGVVVTGFDADATIPDVYKANTDKQIHTYIHVCIYKSTTHGAQHTHSGISLA